MSLSDPHHDARPATAPAPIRRAQPGWAIWAALLAVAQRPRWQRLGLAVLIVLAAVALRVAFLGELGRGTAYITFYPAVMLAALCGGWAAGLLASTLCALLSYAWIQQRQLSPTEWLALVVFVLSSLLVSSLSTLLHRAVHLLREEADERTRTGAALHESQARYQSILENMIDAVVLSTPDGAVLAANPAACQLFGRTEAEICRLGRAGLVDTTDPRLTSFLAARGTAGRARAELTLLRGDGSRFEAEAASSLFTDALGRTCTSIVIRDLTTQRLAAAKLELAAREWQTTFDATRDAVWLLDRDSRIVRANRAAELLFGHSHTAMKGCPCWAIAHGTTAPISDCPLVRAARSLRREATELTIGDRWYEVIVDPIIDAAGLFAGAVHSVSDITERRKSIKALQESEARYRSLFELESDALFLIDNTTGEILEANRAAASLYGRTHDELVRLRNTDLSAEPDSTRQAMQDQAKQIPVRHHRRADGTVFPVEIVANHFTWEGRSVHLAGIRDITERLRREEELRRASLRAQSLLRIAEPRQETDQEFLDRALTEALAITDSCFGYIYHYEEEKQRFILNTWSKDVMAACRVAEPRTSYDLDRTGIWGEAVRQRRPILLNEFPAAHPLKKGYPEGHVALTRFLTIPVFEGERIVAVVGVANKPYDYDEGDIVQLQLLMGSVWRALEHRRAELRIRDQYTLLRGLLEAFDTPVFSLDHDLRYTSFNRPHAEAMRTLYGAEIALGHNILDYQPPEDRPATEGNLRRVLADTPLLVEAYSGTGAARRFYEINHTPIHDATDQVCGIAVLARDLTARRSMEEALREAERFARATIDGLSAHLCVLDETGTILATNQAWRHFAETNPPVPDNVQPGANYLAICDAATGPEAADAHAFAAGIRSVLSGEQKLFTQEYPCHSPTAQRWFIGRVTRFSDTGPVRLVVAHEAITQRRHAEEALLAAHANLEHLVQERTAALAETNRLLAQTSHLARVGGWEVDLRTGTNTWSGATREIHEVAEDFIPTVATALSFYAPEAQPLIATAVQRASTTGEPFDLELPFITAQGHHLWVRATGQAVREQGRIVKIRGVFQDITTGREAEDELRRHRDHLEELVHERTVDLRASEERFRRAVVDSPFPILLHAEDGAILQASNSWCKITGYSREELATIADWTERAYGERKQPVRAAIEALYALDGPKPEGDYRIRTRSGAHRIWEFSSAPLGRLPDGRRLVISMALDVTDRRQAEAEVLTLATGLERRVVERTHELTTANERLRELDRLKSEFLSTMSHELRTPLNSIVGFTGILLKELSGPLNPEQNKQLSLVQSSARHLLALINDLLDLSRIESGRIELHHEPFDFAGVVAEVVSFLHPIAAQKSLALRADCTPVALPLVGDRRRSLQILLNLATNAVKFTGRGEVALTASVVDGHLVVAVRDTGIGIRPDQLPHLFEAFRQLDASARRHYEGTGLGLHLCKKLLGLLGGSIAVESVAGSGSTFTFTLPLAPVPPSGAGNPVPPSLGGGGTPAIPPPGGAGFTPAIPSTLAPS